MHTFGSWFIYTKNVPVSAFEEKIVQSVFWNRSFMEESLKM